MERNYMRELKENIDYAKIAPMGELRRALSAVLDNINEVLVVHNREIRTLKGRFNDIAGL